MMCCFTIHDTYKLPTIRDGKAVYAHIFDMQWYMHLNTFFGVSGKKEGKKIKIRIEGNEIINDLKQKINKN